MKSVNQSKQPVVLRRLTPDYFAKNILDIDFLALKNRGITAAAIDVDSTLLALGHEQLSPDTESYLRHVKESGQIEAFFIATNRRNNDVEALAKSIGATVTHAHGWRDSKPWSPFFNRLKAEMKRPPEACAMIGDKVFTDILGGNRAGFHTILVERLGEDSLADTVTPFRALERYLVNKYEYKKSGH